MNYDRKITISAAAGRTAKSWPVQELYWSEFCEKLKTPVRSTETLSQYLKMTKSQQDDLKDVGGFVGGRVQGARQKANIESRDLITLDLDNIPANGTDKILRILESLQCAYCVYSTRKHEPIRPRLRVIIPLSRSCSADEYEPIVRKIAQMIGIEYADPVSFRSNQLMYWPSACADGSFVYRVGDKPMADPEGILALYDNWKDVSHWPRQPSEEGKPERLAKKQQDPAEKTGIVGAFCAAYDIYRAMEELIPGAYLPTEKDNRYTYAEGTTTGGAIVYDGGKFLYSHHATDPAGGGKLTNAFDLVRLHKFGHLDEEADPATPVSRLPSYAAMKEYAAGMPEVTTAMAKERLDKARGVFGAEETPKEEDDSWIADLTVNKNGDFDNTISNVAIIVERDPLLQNSISYDKFRRYIIITGKLPWSGFEGVREWKDDDDAGLRMYMETAYGITGKDRIYDGLTNAVNKKAINGVKDYLEGLPAWDGTPRLDTLFIDYLGAEDNVYVRDAARKSFTAAVARIYEPGIKYDYMPILTGPQGIGKTTLLRIMGGPWYSDNIVTFEGKDAAEALQGRWILEVGELSAMGRSRTEIMKQFISRQEDIYRKAYGRRAEKYPRQCVIFGTTNEAEFLRDPTGNRRFWPIDTPGNGRKDVFTQLEAERDQIWAEAVVRWRSGEKLYLESESGRLARKAQTERVISDPRRGLIIKFLLKKIPSDWNKKDEAVRKLYWATPHSDGGVRRERICPAEIWGECFGNELPNMRRGDSMEINRTLSTIDGLSQFDGVKKFGPYGAQRGYKISDEFYRIYGEKTGVTEVTFSPDSRMELNGKVTNKK
ncbi:MAG: virulence-associated E family protein [Eubacteriales bacterium]|nr:virulence-associated E family protein [Eubacteriales bacterium]